MAKITLSERVIYWGVLLPASLISDAWFFIMLIIGWGWLCQ